MKKLLLFIVVLSALTGCVPAAFVAGATAGGAVVYDHRSTNTMWQDRNTSYQAQMKLNADPALKNKVNISVVTFNHVVLLVGQAPTAELRACAEKIVKQVPHIKRIYNQITIAGPTTAMVRSNDAWITTKVKTEMLTKKGLHSTQLKVVTENSVVYLMGLTTKRQGLIAATVARQVSGVRKVVKLFEYLH